VNSIFRFAAALAALVLFVPAVFSQPLPSCYHRLDQVYDFIYQLQANDSNNVIHIDTIGYSRGDMLGNQYPLLAVKVSDNAESF